MLPDLQIANTKVDFSLQSVNSILPNSFFEKKFTIYFVGKYDLHTFVTNL